MLSDFDGTLGDICRNPTKATINQESKDAFEHLVTRSNVFTAIISGRMISDVRKRAGIDNITYSGNHGMEILFANQSEYHHQITAEMYENCLKLKAILKEKVCAQSHYLDT